MDRVLQSVDPEINCKRCTTCRKAIDTKSLYKTCNACRAKSKLNRQRLRVEMTERQLPAHMDVDNRKYDTAGKQEKVCFTHDDESRKVVAGVKRKAQKFLYELEGEERKVAIKMMKTGLKKEIRRHAKKQQLLPAVKLVAGTSEEYQNARSLYDALKSKALSSYPASNDETQLLQFHGSHTIIAVSSIDNFKRTKLVATDLRKIARLSFEIGAATLSSGPSGSMTLSCSCSCLGYSQVEVQPRTEKLNGAGSLIRWARSNFTSAASQAVPRMCGGKVNVTVLDDNTHSLHILGQQIIVRVDHPNVEL